MTGRVIAVVGPSGVGKDSVMEGLHAALPNAHLVRRVITRDKDAGGEDFDAVSEAEFEELVRNGAFAIHWHAHGLSYGIPTMVKYQLGQGKDCLINFSRNMLRPAESIFPNLIVLNVTAAPETIAKRLVARNRETEAEIAKRLAQADKALPTGLDVRHLPNDGPLAETVARGIALLRPDRVPRRADVAATGQSPTKSETVS
ncbi:phosphonate metabolism protein/1,5-bisphosphokinase (PRPP-forming) PhnN [Tateyamaria armeniaca]|uniref:Ribose 1,5-bisphosphate phosphokinase PhnN n=1 Tax=Tateyamaria armeniaca TaxID=2518930 RepID=A0ABW8USY2_9RHOB